jgi:oligoribonuclease NrnB/cAMP/cGMP phosphodiesterase (DHH superfamily)
MNLFEGRLLKNTLTDSAANHGKDRAMALELSNFYGIKIMNPSEAIKIQMFEDKVLPPLVIYHSPCQDGFTAAWCFHYYGKLNNIEFEFMPGVYQEAPPDCTDRIVYLVDFSYKREVVEEMLKAAMSVTLIDHHKSALDDLLSLEHPNFYKFTDINSSGAGLAWDFLFPLGNKRKLARPQLLNHVEDRDLWKFAYAGTKDVCAGLFAEDYDFDIWTGLMRPHNFHGQQDTINMLRDYGVGINKKMAKDLAEFLPLTKREMVIEGIPCFIANVPYMWASEAGHILANESAYGLGITYWDSGMYRNFSLRSVKKDGYSIEIDVSEIAKRHGGGGHKNAAGFKIQRNSSSSLIYV